MRALLQNALHVLAVVNALFFLAFQHIQVGISRHTNDVCVLDFIHAKNFFSETLNQIFQQNELKTGVSLISRKFNHARRLRRQRYDSKRNIFSAARFHLFAVLVFFGLILRFVVKANNDVNVAIRQMRERMARVNNLRRQKRLHIGVKPVRKERLLVLCQVVF